MSETTEPMAYVGICETCGALCAATVDTPDHKRDTAKFVAELVRDGLRVERVTCQTVRETLRFCDCRKRQKAEAKARASAQAVLNV